MKFLFLSLFSLFLALNTARGSLSDGKVHLSLVSNHLNVKVDDGFHVNLEAPIKVKSTKSDSVILPVSMGTHQIDFDLSALMAVPFRVSFYICDDKNTSCELQKYAYEIKNNELLSVVIKDNESALQLATKLEYNSHHFIKDNLEAALDRAKKDKKLLFVDFGAPWCPACVRLETEVFSTAEFKKIIKKLVTASLNSDVEVNRENYKKYNVLVLPTLIIMNAEGLELHRLIDFKPAKDFNNDLTAALKNSHQTTTELTELALKKDKKALKTLARRAFSESNYKEALKWYELLAEESQDFAIAKTAVAASVYEEDKKNEVEYATLLKKNIDNYPSSYEALEWRLNLSDIDKKNADELLSENARILVDLLLKKSEKEKMFSNTSVGTISFPDLEIYSYLVKTYEKLKSPLLENKSRENFQSEIKKIKTTPKKPGELMMIVQYQREAKMPEEGESLESLVKTYPNSHTYHMKLGGYYFRSKKFSEALKEFQASTALEKPVTIFNLAFLAKTQKELGLIDDMKKTIELADGLPVAKSERSKESLNEMHDLLLKK